MNTMLRDDLGALGVTLDRATDGDGDHDGPRRIGPTDHNAPEDASCGPEMKLGLCGTVLRSSGFTT
jgi:hypothetical protein